MLICLKKNLHLRWTSNTFGNVFIFIKSMLQNKIKRILVSVILGTQVKYLYLYKRHPLSVLISKINN